MSRRYAASALLVGASLMLAACGSSGNGNDDKRPTNTATSNSNLRYEGWEIKDTPCGPNDGSVIDYVEPVKVKLGKVRGVLSLRQSTQPGACNQYFWGRFEPNKAGRDVSKGAFTVLVRTAPKGDTYKQRSAPNPTVDALTKGTHGYQHATIEACLEVTGRKPECIGGEIV